MLRRYAINFVTSRPRANGCATAVFYIDAIFRCPIALEQAMGENRAADAVGVATRLIRFGYVDQ